MHLGATRANTLLRPRSLSSPSLDLAFSSIFSVVVIFALHGLSGFKILAILAVNYSIAMASRGHITGIAFTWLFNIAILFANETYDGYKFGSIHPGLASLVGQTSIMLAVPCLGLTDCLTRKDDVQGFYPRWNVTFNITVLRLISFNMDYIWAVRKRETHEVKVTLDELF